MASSHEQVQWLTEQVQSHEPLLRGYLQRRFPSLPDHDDVVQEVYARLLRAGERQPVASPRGFLFTVARNVAIDMLRRRQASALEPMMDDAPMPTLDEAPEVTDCLDQEQRHTMLVAAIAALPKRCRAVMILRHVEGLSYKEIADRLNLSPNTVKLHIVKGMKDCTAFFRAHGMLEAPSSPPSPQPQTSRS